MAGPIADEHVGAIGVTEAEKVLVCVLRASLALYGHDVILTGPAADFVTLHLSGVVPTVAP